jgi:hypothetical protein
MNPSVRQHEVAALRAANGGSMSQVQNPRKDRLTFNMAGTILQPDTGWTVPGKVHYSEDHAEPMRVLVRPRDGGIEWSLSWPKEGTVGRSAEIPLLSHTALLTELLEQGAQQAYGNRFEVEFEPAISEPEGSPGGSTKEATIDFANVTLGPCGLYQVRGTSVPIHIDSAAGPEEVWAEVVSRSDKHTFVIAILRPLPNDPLGDIMYSAITSEFTEKELPRDDRGHVSLKDMVTAAIRRGISGCRVRGDET